MSCGVGHRCGLDPTLLWLWCRPVATAPIRPLAWEPPYAAGAAQEMTKKRMMNEAQGGEYSWSLYEWPVQGNLIEDKSFEGGQVVKNPTLSEFPSWLSG